MHFVLEYFLAVQRRPRFGTPLWGASGGGRDNAVIPMLFCDHFAAVSAGDARVDACQRQWVRRTIKTTVLMIATLCGVADQFT